MDCNTAIHPDGPYHQKYNMSRGYKRYLPYLIIKFIYVCDHLKIIGIEERREFGFRSRKLAFGAQDFFQD